eukprot:scaffold2.g7463.t1
MENCACGSEEEACWGVCATDGSGGGTLLSGPPPPPKPNLGGYRHRKTGAEFHHACSQTEPSPEQQAAQAAAVACSTQTVELRSTAVQCRVDAGSQVPRASWYVGMSELPVVEPAANYQTADEWLATRHTAACTIQRWWRGGQGRRTAAKAMAAQAAEAAAREEAMAAAAVRAEAAAAYEVRRRIQPRRPSDFQLLREELSAWVAGETARITAATGGSDAGRRAALEGLLAKETKLLQTIDKLRLKAAGPNRDAAVDTTDTRRAGQLGDAYRQLVSSEGGGPDARLAALLAVKCIVKAGGGREGRSEEEYDCPACDEIVGLIDREADLTRRGRPAASLAGLRQRIASRFLAFIKTPASNPAAVALQIRPAVQSPAAALALADWLSPPAGGLCIMQGHKAAFARLRAVAGGISEALIWPKRVVTVGRSRAAALHVDAPLASRVHCALQGGVAASDDVFLSDMSSHGTLVLELPEGMDGSGSVVEELAALPWERAHRLVGTTHRLACASVLVIGAGTDWCSAVAEGRAAEALRHSGAVVLLFEQLLVERALSRLPFGAGGDGGRQTPGRGVAKAPVQGAGGGVSDDRRVHKRRVLQEKQGAPLYQAFSLFQAHAEAQRRRELRLEPVPKQRQERHSGGKARKRGRQERPHLQAQQTAEEGKAAAAGAKPKRGGSKAGEGAGTTQAPARPATNRLAATLIRPMAEGKQLRRRSKGGTAAVRKPPRAEQAAVKESHAAAAGDSAAKAEAAAKENRAAGGSAAEAEAAVKENRAASGDVTAAGMGPSPAKRPRLVKLKDKQQRQQEQQGEAAEGQAAAPRGDTAAAPRAHAQPQAAAAPATLGQGWRTKKKKGL